MNWVQVTLVRGNATVYVNLALATSLERYQGQNFTTIKFGKDDSIVVTETPEQIRLAGFRLPDL